tara:strand:- start:225 stop:506 length:282 start_codon:yes stop_codon:yes gene_type:complete
MKVYHPTLTVLTGPEWLTAIFGTQIWNQKQTGYIEVNTDPDGNKYIAKEALNDPDYDFLDGTQVPDPNNPEDVRLIREWLTEIPYCYNDEPID